MLKLFRHNESGSGLIEFAVGGGIVFSVIFAVMDGSRALYTDHFVANIAREASRYAMVRGSTWNGTSCAATTTNNCMATAANVTAFVKANTPAGITPGNLTVTTTWPGTNPSGINCSYNGVTNNPGCIVKVTVKYSFQFIVPILPSGAISLNSTSAIAIAE